MPHFKCEACRTRLHGASILTELVGDLCPDCGARLTQAGGPSELIGFRLVTPRTDEGSLADAVANALPRPEMRR